MQGLGVLGRYARGAGNIHADGEVAELRHNQIDRVTEEHRAGQNPGRCFPVEQQRTIRSGDDGGILAADRNVRGAHIQGRSAKRVGELYADAASADAGPHNHACRLIVESVRGRRCRGGAQWVAGACGGCCPGAPAGWPAGPRPPVLPVRQTLPVRIRTRVVAAAVAHVATQCALACSILSERKRAELQGYGQHTPTTSQTLYVHCFLLRPMLRRSNSLTLQLSEALNLIRSLAVKVDVYSIGLGQH